MYLRQLILPVLAIAALAGVPACGDATVTPGAPATVAFPFNEGKVWHYKATVVTPDNQTVEGDSTLTFVKREGNTATFNLNAKFPGIPEINQTLSGDVTGNPYSSGSKTGAASQESITVPAGTLHVTKETSTETSAESTDTNEIWYNATSGLVKMVMTSKDKEGKTTITTFELK